MIRQLSIHFRRILLPFLSFLSLAQAKDVTVPFAERTPVYFADAYGVPKSAKNVRSHSFIHPTRGGVDVKGEFSVREFRSGDLRVKAVFALPSIKLAAVRLSLPRAWTPEQIEAALKAYGMDWKPVATGPVVRTWIASDGTTATSLISSLEIQSAAIASAVDRTLQATDAKRKAVPKF